MGYFPVRYDSRVVIYECKMFIRLATGLPSYFTFLPISLIRRFLKLWKGEIYWRNERKRRRRREWFIFRYQVGGGGGVLLLLDVDVVVKKWVPPFQLMKIPFFTARMCHKMRKMTTSTVWPDVGIKSNPKFAIDGQKVNKLVFLKNWDNWENPPKKLPKIFWLILK